MTTETNEPGIAEKPEPRGDHPPGRGLVTIVIPCCGMIEYTRRCVRSVLRHSRAPYELLFLDADSLDGTADYLAGIADAAPVRVEIVPTTGYLNGPAGEVNLAMRGEFIVLLSNDALVTPGWLEHLAGLATSDPAIGMVGCMSNQAPPPQRVEALPYRIGPAPTAGTPREPGQAAEPAPLRELDRFAREWADRHQGQAFAVTNLAGPCALVRRTCLKRIGLSLARSRLGTFDLDSVCQRVLQAGMQVKCCRDLFVHSFGRQVPQPKDSR